MALDLHRHRDKRFAFIHTPPHAVHKNHEHTIRMEDVVETVVLDTDNAPWVVTRDERPFLMTATPDVHVVTTTPNATPTVPQQPPPREISPSPASMQTMRTEDWIVDASRSIVDAIVDDSRGEAARMWLTTLACDLDAEEERYARRERELKGAVAIAGSSDVCDERLVSAQRRGDRVMEVAYRCSQSVDAASSGAHTLREAHADANDKLEQIRNRLMRLARPYHGSVWHQRIIDVVEDEESRAREANAAALHAQLDALRRASRSAVLPGTKEDRMVPARAPYVEALADAREKQNCVKAVRVMRDAAVRTLPSLHR